MLKTLCRLIAERMADSWSVTVLASTAREYVRGDLKNDYVAGESLINGVVVRRFLIDHMRSRDEVFTALDRKVLARTASDDEETQWLKEIGPYSSSLISYVETQRDEFDMFVFVGYLYATSTLILPKVKDKAALISDRP